MCCRADQQGRLIPQKGRFMNQGSASTGVLLISNQRLLPYLMDAHRRIFAADVGINRYIGS
jgi:hypothetical protein